MEKGKKEIEYSQQNNELLLQIMNQVNKEYWFPLMNYLEKNTELIQTFPAFLLEQEQIVIYLGDNHIAIEYFGKELTQNLPESKIVKVKKYDYLGTDVNLFEKIIGFKFNSTAVNFTMPLPQISEDLVYPTNKGMDMLIDLKWNWMAQTSMIMGINSPGFHVPKGQFTRVINARFFDADNNGLKTRHIKWVDFLPVNKIIETENEFNLHVSLSELHQLVKYDAHFKYPLPHKNDFKNTKLPQINRFIELIGNNKTSETEITRFLEERQNKFLLTMGILSKEIHAELLLEWQSEQKNDIKPDFLIVRSNGYADIVEFKLPKLKSKSIVGKSNRESFSAEINSYIAQTRVYKEYFQDPNNREWVKNKYGLNVKNPKRFLVVGRRWDFSNEVWKEIIEDYTDIEIITFDELIDGVVSQFYM